jgi:phage baseplate assembly protein V
MDLAYQIAELKRRMDNMIRVGTVVECDYAAEPPVARIKDGEHVSGWIPFMADRANGQEVAWDAPEIGERVMVLALAGELSNSRILPGSFYCEDHPPPAVQPDVITRMHKDGAHDTYNRDLMTRTIQIPDGGTVNVLVGESLFSITGGGVTLTTPQITMMAEGAINMHGQEITLHGKVNLGGKGGKPVARKDDTISTETKKITKGSSNVKSK